MKRRTPGRARRARRCRHRDRDRASSRGCSAPPTPASGANRGRRCSRRCCEPSSSGYRRATSRSSSAARAAREPSRSRCRRTRARLSDRFRMSAARRRFARFATSCSSCHRWRAPRRYRLPRTMRAQSAEERRVPGAAASGTSDRTTSCPARPRHLRSARTRSTGTAAACGRSSCPRRNRSAAA